MIHIVDFEASGLAIPDSYPIEYGFATIDPLTHEITHGGSLIVPHADWNHWNFDCEVIHGIPRTVLHNGVSPYVAALELNAVFGDRVVYCDGRHYDIHWADRLYQAAGINRSWQISDYREFVFDGPPVAIDDYIAVGDMLNESTGGHRAPEDARVLANNYLVAKKMLGHL